MIREKELELPKEARVHTFRQFKEINYMILDRLRDTLNTYIHCWYLSDNFKKHALFTDKGIRIFSFKEYEEFKLALAQQFSKEAVGSNASESIKAQILKILRPLSSQFPSEFLQAFLVNINIK
jgi:hypothetical protein